MKTKVGDYVRMCYSAMPEKNPFFSRGAFVCSEAFKVTHVFKRHVRVWYNEFPVGPLLVRSWVRVRKGDAK